CRAFVFCAISDAGATAKSAGTLNRVRVPAGQGASSRSSSSTAWTSTRSWRSGRIASDASRPPATPAGGTPSTDGLNVAERGVGERPSVQAYGCLRLRLTGDVLSVLLATASDGPTLRDRIGHLHTSRYGLPRLRSPVDEIHCAFEPCRARPHGAVPLRISPAE